MRFRDRFSIIAVALLGLLFVAAYTFLGPDEKGNPPLKGEPAVYHPKDEGGPAPTVPHQIKAAEGKAKDDEGFGRDLAAALGEILPAWVWDDRTGRSRRFLVAAPIAIVILLGFLVRSGLLEDRRAKRGRLVPVIKEGGAAVRIVNVGDGIARLEAFGCVLGRFDGDWRRLINVRRLVSEGDDDPVIYAFDDTRVETGMRFSVLLRYEDAHRGAWRAQRVFRMLPARHVAVEEDSEQPEGVNWRRHRWFPLLIVLLLLSMSSSS